MTLSSSGKLRGALVGYGFIQSKGHVPAYLKRDDVEIVAIADICEERRYQASALLPSARVYLDFEHLLEQEEGLDFVDIATPPVEHAKQAIKALEKGVHVLCEKPLATSIEEATAMVSAAHERRRVLFPCHNYKHAPVIKAIQEIINSGRIGNVRSVTLNTFRNTHAKGVPEWRPHWRREHRFGGGGIAMDHGSHSFYLTFDWLKSYPTAVTAKMSNLQPDRFDTEDNFSAVLTFPTGLANLHLSWTAGVRKVIYTIQGDRGAIVVDDDDMQIALMEATSGPDVAQGAVRWNVERRSIASDWMDASHVHWFNSLFDRFKEAIAREDYGNKDLREAFLCVQTIATAYRSAGTHCQELALEQVIPGNLPLPKESN